MEVILSICLGIGLSAATGFRIFIPALLANIAAMNGFIHPGDNFEWLASWPAFWILATASVFEIAAYYIPVVDNFLDTIATPVALIAGALLTTSFMDVSNPALQWGLGIIIGGGTAGVVQTGTNLLRLTSTGTTGGIANPIVSTIENISSFVITIMSIFIPVIALIIVGLVVWFIFRKLKQLNKAMASQPENVERNI